MVRLFSAIEVPAGVRTAVAARIEEIRAGADDADGAELAWTPPSSWHITIGFYGDREHPDRRGTWFRRQAADLARPRIRLRAAGRFPGVLWLGVGTQHRVDTLALRQIAGALIDVGGLADPREFVPHVTVARWRRGAAGTAAAAEVMTALGGFTSEWWSVDELVLFRSDPGPDGSVYTALDRVRLAGKQR